MTRRAASHATIALRDAISETFGDLARRPETKVVIVTGAGDVFSAGFDLDEAPRDAPIATKAKIVEVRGIAPGITTLAI